MPYGFEIRTKEGQLIWSIMNSISFSLRDTVFLARLRLKDEQIPKGSKLKIFKINETRYTYKKR